MRSRDLLEALTHLAREVPASFPRLVQILCRRWHRQRPSESATCCLPIAAGVWLRPDAYLYSQRFLMSLGMAVTWDNPDVSLTDLAGNPVGSHDLLPATEYRITVSIHNHSHDAPAPGLPVIFTLLAFGAGGPSRQAIGVASIDLPVRAAPGEPATASVVWRTPPLADHYCIEIEAAWPDDAHPIDNVGQHNTVLKSAPRGTPLRLPVPVYGRAPGARALLRLDTYQLPERPLLRDAKAGRAPHRERVIAANRPARHDPEPGWGARLSSQEVILDEGAMAIVQFDAMTPPDAAVGSMHSFNISAFDQSSGQALGGVTLTIKVT